MDLAQRVASQFIELETGFRNGLYKCLAGSLTCYRKFLDDHESYRELLRQENISKLREKPKLKDTSRLVLYFITNARTDAERNTAGKYARVVDYLYKEGVRSAYVVEHLGQAGGVDAILKKMRKREALKATDETLQDDDRDFDQQEEARDAGDSASSDGVDALFDPAVDISTRVGSETRELVLSSKIPMNKVFYLECQKTGSLGHDGILIEGRLFDEGSE
jgi:hypothetical protein